jgi:hypothetical protein
VKHTPPEHHDGDDLRLALNEVTIDQRGRWLDSFLATRQVQAFPGSDGILILLIGTSI